MTVRASRQKRARLAGRRRISNARPAEQRALPLLVVKEGGRLEPLDREAAPAR